MFNGTEKEILSSSVEVHMVHVSSISFVKFQRPNLNKIMLQKNLENEYEAKYVHHYPLSYKTYQQGGDKQTFRLLSWIKGQVFTFLQVASHARRTTFEGI